jgi:hypothetical protein
MSIDSLVTRPTHTHTHMHTYIHTRTQVLPISSLIDLPGIRQDQIASVMLQLHNPFDVPIQISVVEAIPSGPRTQAMVHDMLVAGSRESSLQSQGELDGKPIAPLNLFARDIVEVRVYTCLDYWEWE